MLEFFKKRRSTCPVCQGRGILVVDDIYEKCFACDGTGKTLESSERTDLTDQDESWD